MKFSESRRYFLHSLSRHSTLHTSSPRALSDEERRIFRGHFGTSCVQKRAVQRSVSIGLRSGTTAVVSVLLETPCVEITLSCSPIASFAKRCCNCPPKIIHRRSSYQGTSSRRVRNPQPSALAVVILVIVALSCFFWRSSHRGHSAMLSHLW